MQPCTTTPPGMRRGEISFPMIIYSARTRAGQRGNEATHRREPLDILWKKVYHDRKGAHSRSTNSEIDESPPFPPHATGPDLLLTIVPRHGGHNAWPNRTKALGLRPSWFRRASRSGKRRRGSRDREIAREGAPGLAPACCTARGTYSLLYDMANNREFSLPVSSRTREQRVRVYLFKHKLRVRGSEKERAGRA